MKISVPVAVALLALGIAGSSPALAQTSHRADPSSHRQMYMYAPGEYASPAASYAASPDYTPYPSGLPRTGTQENRSQWDPSYIPGAPD
jgi:hypothetical protein